LFLRFLEFLGCSSTNCNLVLTEAEGRITSPCYPQKYPNSQACKWTLQAPVGFIIQLYFLDFDLEEAPGCIYDRVVVNTGNTGVKFCGPTANGLTLNSTGNVMELSFSSDFSVQKRGFHVSYRHGRFRPRPAVQVWELFRHKVNILWFFTYYDTQGNTALSLRSDQSGMKLTVDRVDCSISSIISSTDFTSAMKHFCVLWTSSTGQVAVYFHDTYKTQPCHTSSGHFVLGGGQFVLGGPINFDGYIYNLRLWDYTMTVEQLHALTCGMVGNIIDWDSIRWNIPSTVAETDTSLSCSEYSKHPHRGAVNYDAGLWLVQVSVALFRPGSCSLSSCLSTSFLHRLHYHWPESRPNVTLHLPSVWRQEVNSSSAACLQVSKVVTKVQELVNVAKINQTLASTVVTIISNVMSSSETALAATSEKALRTVDELVQKLEFEGPSVNITSRHLALGILALNTSLFNGTSFSAFIPPNSTEPQIDFEAERINPLAQVTLPASLLSDISLSEANTSTLSRINFMFFSNTNLFQKEQHGRSLNSYVVASSVGNFSISGLKEPVQIEIAHLSAQPPLNPVCMFWDFSMNNGAGGWNGTGCKVSNESSSNRTVCLCDHLTHFGILMDISGVSPNIDPRNSRILTFITYMGCGVSAIFSAATLLTYIAFEKLRRDYPSKILMNLSASLLLLNMVFLLDGWLATLKSEWLCPSVAILLHYFLLTSFTWMGLESIHMYIALVKVFNTYIRRYILKFCIVGWGLPALLVCIVVAASKNSYGLITYGSEDSGDGSEFCWIHNPVVFYTTCVGYFCLMFLLNVAMFIVVMKQICGRNGKRTNRTLREEVLRNLRSVISLTFLLGMTWGFALFAWGPVSLAFMYLFTIFNSLQGLFIFIFHCALKENVQKQWRRYLCCGRFRLSDNSGMFVYLSVCFFGSG
uniref:Adhesion G-protein coupled receptor G6 n=1 Tax=Mastacembelus armatus TaxID=205130 RepID=A0A3Q3L7B9_9TELE